MIPTDVTLGKPGNVNSDSLLVPKELLEKV
jgi:hypothetical protein